MGAAPQAALAVPAAVVSGGRRAWSVTDNPAVQESGGGTAPKRHRFDLPRGRGPSQTPKFLSPGPPSPWLPALLIGNRFLSVLRQTMGSAPGMQGAKPLA